MKIFRELFITGTEADLRKIVEYFEQHQYDEWIFSKMFPGTGDEYLDFEYHGDKLPHAAVALFFNKEEKKYFVSNIIPLEKSELSTEEYNSILMMFYHDIIQNINIPGLNFPSPTSDEFDISVYLSNEALQKLKYFSLNKSTGSHHPLDRNRWYEFIIYTYKHEKYKEITESVLTLILQSLDWEESIIEELVSEYQFGIGLLEKYMLELV